MSNTYIYPITKIIEDFPILQTQIYNKPLVYLDNGATTQKPNVVIDAISDYYKHINSNVHRGVHYLSQRATDAHEAARVAVQKFINAANDYEIIFTRGTTESINLVAYSFCKAFLKPGDEVLITEMEHHSNIVPWQLACEDRGGTINAIKLTDSGELDLSNLDELLTEKTKIVALTWVSNTLGTVNDIRTIIQKAHAKNIPVLIDAAQAIQHLKVDVQDMDIDFLVFSGHKIYGPTGIGVVYGKAHYLDQMPPYQGGGSMIKTVTLDQTTYTNLPFKFEAGTPDVSGTVGLHAAIDYVNEIGVENIAKHEHEITQYAIAELSKIEGIRFVGHAKDQAATVSFLVNDIHPFDIGELLDKQGVAVRTGHHCCQPIMDHYQIPGTVRASFAMYSTKSDVDALIVALKKALLMLS